MSESITSWDNIFTQHGKVFNEPHEDMAHIVQVLHDKQVSTILDLGCGSGRHIVFLAKHGFSVFGIDNSPEGLRIAKTWLTDENLHAELRLQSMTENFPYEDEFFDAVISVQVIHHATLAVIRGMVGEISRVLKNRGFLFITVPKGKNPSTLYQEIEPNTYLPLNGSEEGLLHHFFTPAELKAVLQGFHVLDIHLDTNNHYCLLGTKM